MCNPWAWSAGPSTAEMRAAAQAQGGVGQVCPVCLCVPLPGQPCMYAPMDWHKRMEQEKMAKSIRYNQDGVPLMGPTVDETRDEYTGPDALHRTVQAAAALHTPRWQEGLPTEAKARKAIPIATGCLDYFPLALAAVAELSRVGNEQHNPGKPLHWNRSKSTDEADALLRHFLQRGTVDTDKVRHSTKVAWRALALLQKEIEAAT